MSEWNGFELTAQLLEEITALSRIEARGTLRIALKQAGFEAGGIEPNQLRVVVGKVLPAQLSGLGLENVEDVCARLAAQIPQQRRDSRASDTPEAVFARLAQR